MKDLERRIRGLAITIPLVLSASGLAIGAAIGASWGKSEVIPVVLVKPGIGGFEPVDGDSIGNIWSKSEVKAVLLVTPGIGGFVPREGSSIGNSWLKEDVMPVMLVEPSVGGFVPLQSLVNGSGSSGYPPPGTPEAKEPTRPAPTDLQQTPSVIEGQIDGDFEGWEGETIIKLTNGQIWQQSEYYYTYHYAFMPNVLIFKSGYGFKMKVDGVDRPVGVTRLR